jgi:hypothetical protein
LTVGIFFDQLIEKDGLFNALQRLFQVKELLIIILHQLSQVPVSVSERRVHEAMKLTPATYTFQKIAIFFTSQQDSQG